MACAQRAEHAVVCNASWIASVISLPSNLRVLPREIDGGTDVPRHRVTGRGKIEAEPVIRRALGLYCNTYAASACRRATGSTTSR